MASVRARLAMGLVLMLLMPSGQACTGISLIANNGEVIAARTMEWGSFDLNTSLAVYPANANYTTSASQHTWGGKYGFVGMVALRNTVLLADALNEAGLSVGVFYFPNFASYGTANTTQTNRTVMTALEIAPWMLSQFDAVKELRAALTTIQVVEVPETEKVKLGFQGPLAFHWKVADRTGAAVIIEIVDGGKLHVYDAVLGVLTNAPSYPWHVTNLRNYVNLAPEPAYTKHMVNQTIKAIRSGSGVLGLPGDFTPPSRFVRAAVFTATARPLRDAADARDEAFRILGGFDICGHRNLTGLLRDTQFTTVSDLPNRVYYFTTMYNRRARIFNLTRVVFVRFSKAFLVPSDLMHEQDVLDVTPATPTG